jgi:hypothetical protein
VTQIAQARLKSGVSTITTWIDLKPGVKPGAVVTLKGDDRRWEVERLGAPTEADEVRNLGRRHREVHGGLQ